MSNDALDEVREERNSLEEEVRRLRGIIDDRDTAIEILLELNCELQSKYDRQYGAVRPVVHQVVHCTGGDCARGNPVGRWIYAGKKGIPTV
jgi:hypothetical protein